MALLGLFSKIVVMSFSVVCNFFIFLFLFFKFGWATN